MLALPMAIFSTKSSLLPTRAVEIVAPALAPDLAHEIGRERGIVCAVVGRMLREPTDSADVEDVASESMRRAIEGASQRKGPLRPWLLGIARHVTLDRIRSRRRERARIEPDRRADEDGSETAIDLAASDAPLADEVLAAQQRAESVRAALTKLPDGQRRALELFHLDGLDYQGISSRLGVPLGTVATWILRGRKTLAETLGSDGDAR